MGGGEEEGRSEVTVVCANQLEHGKKLGDVTTLDFCVQACLCTSYEWEPVPQVGLK